MRSALSFRHVVWIVAGVVILFVALEFLRDLQPAYRGPGRPRPLSALPQIGESRPFSVVVGSLTSGLITLSPPDSGLVIHYWATWNRESRSEMPLLDSLVRTHPPGPRVVAVTADPMPSVARYVRRRRMLIEVLLDPQGELQRVAPRRVIPATLVFDREGRLVASVEGPVDWWSPTTRATLRRAARGGFQADAKPAS